MRNPLLLIFQSNLHQLKGRGGGRREGRWERGKIKGGGMGKRVLTANADGTVESRAKVERAPR